MYVLVHLCGVWRVLCMSNIDKTLVNFLFQVNSKTAFQVNFWLMGLYLPARLHTSLDLREAACRFTANKVFSPQGKPEFSSLDRCEKTGDLSYSFTPHFRMIFTLYSRTIFPNHSMIYCMKQRERRESLFKDKGTFYPSSNLRSSHSVLNLMVIEMLNFQERAAEDFEAGVGQEAEIGQLAPTDRKYCVDFSNR